MQIKLADNKAVWDSFLAKNQAIFTQSWDWGQILIAEGKKVERLLILDDNEVVGAVLAVYHFFPFGIKYASCAWGPVWVQEKASECLDELDKYFQNQGCVFARIEPLILDNIKNDFKLHQVKDVSPSHTLILDLTQTEEQILSKIEKKTRYEIRQAQKNNLEVKEYKDFDIFWNLMKKTSKHDGFRTHSEAHYKKILDNDNSIQLNAYYHGQPIATAIFWEWNKIFTYLFAATDRNFNSLSAAYLIQSEAVKMARDKGFEKYDFFGVAPKITKADERYDYSREHRYAGFTKFKLGFGGEYHNYPGTYDLILNTPKYCWYKVLHFLRRIF